MTRNSDKDITHQRMASTTTFGTCTVSGCDRDAENLVERTVNGEDQQKGQCRLHTFSHQKVIQGPGPK